MRSQNYDTVDYLIIGSGFGGSVSAMRLVEKGYSVLVLERGKRFRDQDFATNDWQIRKLIWLPALRLFGIWQWTLLNGAMIVHGSGVGGGSLVYANVLMEPSETLFDEPEWSRFADWKTVLRPHYETARRMLGVNTNPRLWPADNHLRSIAKELGYGATFRPTEVGVFFNEDGEPGDVIGDPYFDGMGPDRQGCIHCGGCMTGCRHNAKNTLVKNYLYFAEQWGAKIQAEAEVTDIRPLSDNQADGARYEVEYQRSTAWIKLAKQRVRARNVIVSAGALGTVKLLFHCRDKTQSLSKLSRCLGDQVRTNSEEITAVTSRRNTVDYSKGVAISSIFQADEVTQIEPVRMPEGSSLLARLVGAPMLPVGHSIPVRLVKTFWTILRHPIDFLRYKIMAKWAERATIVLTMQTTNNMMKLRQGRNFFTLFRRGLICLRDEDHPVEGEIEIGHKVTDMLADKTDGIPGAFFNQTLMNIPSTAHIMGGVPFGETADDGVIGLNCEVYHYPRLYVIDGSIMPGNPGINPSLTITALAEYAMEQIPPKSKALSRKPLMRD